jgi:hypothetical protein
MNTRKHLIIEHITHWNIGGVTSVQRDTTKFYAAYDKVVWLKQSDKSEHDQVTPYDLMFLLLMASCILWDF